MADRRTTDNNNNNNNSNNNSNSTEIYDAAISRRREPLVMRSRPLLAALSFFFR